MTKEERSALHHRAEVSYWRRRVTRCQERQAAATLPAWHEYWTTHLEVAETILAKLTRGVPQTPPSVIERHQATY